MKFHNVDFNCIVYTVKKDKDWKSQLTWKKCHQPEVTSIICLTSMTPKQANRLYIDWLAMVHFLFHLYLILFSLFMVIKVFFSKYLTQVMLPHTWRTIVFIQSCIQGYVYHYLYYMVRAICTLTILKLTWLSTTGQEKAFYSILAQLKEIWSLNLYWGIEDVNQHSSTLRYNYVIEHSLVPS